MTKEDVIGWLEFLSKQEHVKADGIVPCDTEIALGMAIKALKQPEIVRCKDCKKRNSWECWQYFFGRMNLPDDYYCADGKAKDGEQE